MNCWGRSSSWLTIYKVHVDPHRSSYRRIRLTCLALWPYWWRERDSSMYIYIDTHVWVHLFRIYRVLNVCSNYKTRRKKKGHGSDLNHQQEKRRESWPALWRTTASRKPPRAFTFTIETIYTAFSNISRRTWLKKVKMVNSTVNQSGHLVSCRTLAGFCPEGLKLRIHMACFR